MRDASGNIMGVYERTNSRMPESGYYKARWKLAEVPLYGSDRLGIYGAGQVVAERVFHIDDFEDVSFESEELVRVS
ncbi:MAG: hypothetical protein NZ529_11740, partial [Cytophagaceae bacterium]|nr:hypothetical protein [Cytophagaceae bacterium]MDW8457456.1 hypothetical protein [Cytophagaceae bacterium]